MVIFKHLRDKRCPHCGSEIYNAVYGGTHSNGEQFENIRYECGYTIRWVPNFSNMEIICECTRTESFKDKHEKVMKIKSDIIDFVSKHDISDTKKKKINECINNIFSYGHV